MSNDPAVAEGREGASPVASVGGPQRTSLKERMRSRKTELEDRTTEIFPVPRWTEVLAVELKAIPWSQSEEAVRRHQRQPKRLSLLAAADEIVEATVGFYEIDAEDGSLEPVSDATWRKIASGVLDDLPANMPPSTADRTCLINLCSDQGVIALDTSFRQWLVGANTGIGEELRRDFRETP